MFMPCPGCYKHTDWVPVLTPEEKAESKDRDFEPQSYEDMLGDFWDTLSGKGCVLGSGHRSKRLKDGRLYVEGCPICGGAGFGFEPAIASAGPRIDSWNNRMAALGITQGTGRVPVPPEVLR